MRSSVLLEYIGCLMWNRTGIEWKLNCSRMTEVFIVCSRVRNLLSREFCPENLLHFFFFL